MKNELENIDKLFKKSLENYTQTPPSDLFENAIKEIGEKPNFFHFFKMKYLLWAIIPVAAFIVWELSQSINSNSTKNAILANNTTRTVEMMQSNNFTEVKKTDNQSNDSHLKQIKKSNQTAKQEIKSGNSTNQPRKTTVSEVIENKQHPINKIEKKTAVSNPVNHDKLNTISTPVKTVKATENTTSTAVTKSSETAQINENHNPIAQNNSFISTQLNSSINSTFEANSTTNHNSNSSTENSSTINSGAINYSNTIKTIPKVDSVATADKSIGITPVPKKRDWSIELFGVENIQYTTLKSNKTEFNDFVEKRKNSFSPTFSSSNYGFLVGINKGPFTFQAGFSYSQLTEATNYGDVFTNPRIINNLAPNGTPYNYVNNNNYYFIDTTQYWHYTYISNPLIQAIDSVIALNMDTTLVNAFDTIKKTAYDTLKLSNLTTRYSLVEFPIWVGYEFNKSNRRWGYALQIGVTPALMIKQQGSYFNGKEEAQVTSETFPMRKFVIFGSAKASILYNLNHRMVLSLGPEAKTTFFSVTNPQNGWSQLWSSCGIHFGIKYYLNR